MSDWVAARDISTFQGNWRDTGEPIVMIKMAGGDDGLYMDSQAANNYENAVKDGRAVGGYFFAGGSNPSAEAAYFLKAMEPLAENDVYAVDIERGSTWNPNAPGVDPVAWTLAFNTYIHDKIGVWPLVYMNLSTLQAHDWSPVLKNSGLWLADWAVSPDANIPTHYTYVMQQYSDGPVYDHDVWFGTMEGFKDSGYHAPVTSQPDPSSPPSTPPQSAATPPLQTPPTTRQIPVEFTPTRTTVTVTTTPSSGTSSTAAPDRPVVVSPSAPAPLATHTVDVLTRTVKTYIASLAAILVASGLDITHLSTPQNVKISGLAAIVTLIMNVGIKLYNASKAA